MSYVECKQQCVDAYQAILDFDRNRLTDYREFNTFADLVDASQARFYAFEKEALISKAKTAASDYDQVLVLSNKADRKIANARKLIVLAVKEKVGLDAANDKISKTRQDVSTLQAVKVAKKQLALVQTRASKLPFVNHIALELIGLEIEVLILFGI